MKRRVVIVLLVVIALAAYGFSYMGLRASHRIAHYSNANHWDPEKRSTGHYVGTANDSDWQIELAFKPLMLLEQAFHNVTELTRPIKALLLTGAASRESLAATFHS